MSSSGTSLSSVRFRKSSGEGERDRRSLSRAPDANLGDQDPNAPHLGGQQFGVQNRIATVEHWPYGSFITFLGEAMPVFRVMGIPEAVATEVRQTMRAPQYGHPAH